MTKIYHAVMRLWAKIAGKHRDPWASVLAVCLLLTSCTSYAGELPKPGELFTYDRALEISTAQGWTVDVQLLKQAGPFSKYCVSDGCSGGSPQTWRGVSLYPYCLEHDIAYCAGGSQYDKLLADSVLMLRVARGTGDIEWAVTMFNLVHLGGNLPTSFGWGQVGVVPGND